MNYKELVAHIADNIANDRMEGAGLFHKGRKSGIRHITHVNWIMLEDYTNTPPIKKHNVNGFEVPVPIREHAVLSAGKTYYLAAPHAEKRYVEASCTLSGRSATWWKEWLRKGVLFATPEAAQQTADAWCGIAPPED